MCHNNAHCPRAAMGPSASLLRALKAEETSETKASLITCCLNKGLSERTSCVNFSGKTFLGRGNVRKPDIWVGCN